MGDAASKASAVAGWRTRTVIAFAEGVFQYWGGPDFPAFPAAAFGQNSSCSHDQVPPPLHWITTAIPSGVVGLIGG